MLTVAYDHLRPLGESAFELLANAPLPRRGRTLASMFTAYAVMAPDRFRIADAAACAADGTPFLYPIEFDYRFMDSYPPGTPPVVEGVSPAVLEAARAGRALLVLFFGHEPRSLRFPDGEERTVFDLVHSFIRAHDLPPGAVFLLNGNLAGDAEFLAWRNGCGFAEDETLQFRTIDFWGAFTRETHRLQTRGLELSGTIDPVSWVTRLTLGPAAQPYEARYQTPERVRRELASGGLRGKTYMNLNSQPRLHRQLVVSWLAATGLLERGHVSFPLMDRNLNGAETWPEEMAHDRDAWFALHRRLPLSVDIGDPMDAIGAVYVNLFFVQPRLFPYDDSYVNLTSETFYFADDLLFLSEKSFKPLAYMQPMLLMGNAGALGALRAMGFQTFGRRIDESYDALPHHGDRLHAAFDEAARLAALSPAAARDLYADLMPEMEHNFHRLTEGRFRFDDVIDEMAARLPG